MSILRSTEARSVGGATGSAKALVKGLALVEAICDADPPVRPADLVEASGLPRPTTMRLLDALVEAGVLRGDSASGYSLGSQVAVWGLRYLDGLDLRREADDLMRALADDTRETCFLGIRERREVLYVAAAHSPQAVRPAARVGSRNPLHSTGIGKVLLAYGAPETTDEYLHGPIVTRTPNTITEPERLRVELEAIRRRGWSIDDVENEDGVRCVAAPIYDHTSAVVASMSVAAPAYRFSLDDLPRIAERLLQTSAKLSTRIGYRRPS